MSSNKYFIIILTWKIKSMLDSNRGIYPLMQNNLKIDFGNYFNVFYFIIMLLWLWNKENIASKISEQMFFGKVKATSK